MSCSHMCCFCELWLAQSYSLQNIAFYLKPCSKIQAEDSWSTDSFISTSKKRAINMFQKSLVQHVTEYLFLLLMHTRCRQLQHSRCQISWRFEYFSFKSLLNSIWHVHRKLHQPMVWVINRGNVSQNQNLTHFKFAPLVCYCSFHRTEIQESNTPLPCDGRYIV